MDQSKIDAEEDRLTDLVDKWHQGGSGTSLREYLGMTEKMYWLWVRDPAAYYQSLAQPPQQQRH
jgi:hypothetical protein